MIGLRQPQQQSQFAPSQRLSRRNVVDRDVGAPAVVVELEDLQPGVIGLPSAIALPRLVFGVNLLRDFPRQMVCTDAQRTGDVAMKTGGGNTEGLSTAAIWGVESLFIFD